MREEVTVRLLGPDDHDLVMDAGDLFDAPPIAAQTAAVLASGRDFLWFAFSGNRPVAFASATSVLHPDQPPNLFFNELGVHEDFRRRGVATRLVEAVVDYARCNDIWPVWVLAEGDDRQAIAFYRSLSGLSQAGAVFFEWEQK